MRKVQHHTNVLRLQGLTTRIAELTAKPDDAPLQARQFQVSVFRCDKECIVQSKEVQQQIEKRIRALEANSVKSVQELNLRQAQERFLSKKTRWDANLYYPNIVLDVKLHKANAAL